MPLPQSTSDCRHDSRTADVFSARIKIKMLPKIAFIGTGETIASIGTNPFDLLDYNVSEERVDAATLIESADIRGVLADIILITSARSIAPPSEVRIGLTCTDVFENRGRARCCRCRHRDGTAGLEETAWALSLVLDVQKPAVPTVSMPPLTGISTDAHANLAASIRAASNPGRAVVFRRNQ
jgi:L-asparaginase